MTTLTAAWQRALTAEQQAAFGYALLGPHLVSADQDDARSCQTVHEDVRDRVTSLIAASGVAPVAPLGDYPTLYPLLPRPAVLAVTLEDDCADAWRYLYSAASATTTSTSGSAAPSGSAAAIGTAASARATAQRELIASAVRATQWRVRARSTHPVVPFPGI